MISQNPILFPKIENMILSLDTENIPKDRKQVLQPLIEYVQAKVTAGEDLRLNFICTHNSRRSHLSQVWAQAMALHFDIKSVFCYSGGTEATALFPMVATTLEHSGFQIQKISEGNNPVYSIKFSKNSHPVIGFSKKYDDNFNPASAFGAVVTCSHADDNCPFIPGAEIRIPVTYEDPKAFDNSPQAKEKYRERSLQIATELFYVFSQIKSI